MDTSNWWLGHQVLIAPQWIREVRWFDNMVAVDATADREGRATVRCGDAAEPRPGNGSLSLPASWPHRLLGRGREARESGIPRQTLLLTSRQGSAGRLRRARSIAWRMNRTHRVRCRSDGRRSLPADASTDSITAPRAPSRREGPRLDQSPGPQFHGFAMSFTHPIDMQLIDPITQALRDHLNTARAGALQRVARVDIVDIVAFAVCPYR